MNRPFAVTLRLARVQEARAMAEMSRDLIEGGLRWRYTPQRMRALMHEDETAALVACDGTGLQGFAVMQFGDVHAHLALLCVQPAQRQRGIGRRLHEWLVGSAQVAGMQSVRLELRSDNGVALSFYRSRGYVESRLVPGYYDGHVAARRMTLSLLAAAP